MQIHFAVADSNVKQPHFTLRKWVSTDNQEFSPEEAKFDEDELLQRKSCSPHNSDGASMSSGMFSCFIFPDIFDDTAAWIW